MSPEHTQRGVMFGGYCSVTDLLRVKSADTLYFLFALSFESKFTYNPPSTVATIDDFQNHIIIVDDFVLSFLE